MKYKYLTVRYLSDGFILPLGLCCGIVDRKGNVNIPERKRCK